MKYLGVKNWNRFQHYGDRRPSWIKTHVEILDNFDFTNLPDNSRSHLMLIWILASKTGNLIPKNPIWVRNKILATSRVNLDLLIQNGFLEELSDSEVEKRRSDFASKSLAKRSKNARLEREEDDQEKDDQDDQEEEREEEKPTTASEPIFLTFKCDGKVKTWDLLESRVQRYEANYKTIDVRDQMRRAWQWLDDNPHKRKTPRGMPNYLTSWLNRAVDWKRDNPSKSKEYGLTYNSKASDESLPF